MASSKSQTPEGSALPEPTSTAFPNEDSIICHNETFKERIRNLDDDTLMQFVNFLDEVRRRRLPFRTLSLTQPRLSSFSTTPLPPPRVFCPYSVTYVEIGPCFQKRT